MKPNAIVLHHSATKDSATVSWQAIRRYHTSYKLDGQILEYDAACKLAAAGRAVERPWADIGYHFGIELIDSHFEVMTGRMMNETGAHCTQQGMNRCSLGICFVGNFDDAAPCDKQWVLGLRLVRCLMQTYDIPVDRVYGHRELASYKSCPGKAFDLQQFRHDLMFRAF